MTAIAAASSFLLRDHTALEKDVANAASAQKAASDVSQQPSVVVSINKASLSQRPASFVADPVQMSNFLADVSGLNGEVDAFNNAKWADIASRFGIEVADKSKASLLHGLQSAQ